MAVTGGGGGGTMGVSHVYHNRDLLKDYHARGGTCPWCPPGSATYETVISRLMGVWHDCKQLHNEAHGRSET